MPQYTVELKVEKKEETKEEHTDNGAAGIGGKNKNRPKIMLPFFM